MADEDVDVVEAVLLAVAVLADVKLFSFSWVMTQYDAQIHM
jgi:hypothetical protein